MMFLWFEYILLLEYLVSFDPLMRYYTFAFCRFLSKAMITTFIFTKIVYVHGFFFLLKLLLSENQTWAEVSYSPHLKK